MDHHGSAEFASERFFSKLQEQEHQVNGSATAFIPSSSTFILPVHEGGYIEDAPPRPDQKQKASFASSLRFKLLKTHSGLDPEDRLDLTRRRSVVPGDLLFRNLPVELQLQVYEFLSFSDVLNLRAVSRSWHALVTEQNVWLARFHLRNSIPAYALRLFPVPANPADWFYHLCTIWSRLHISAKIAHLTCDWVIAEIFLRRTPAQRAEFAAQRERMRRRLIPIVFTIFHFFETYRQLHAEYVMSNPGHGLHFEPYTLNPIEARIMQGYDDQILLRVHEVFPVVISTFCRQLRPPTYAGTIERGIRGYHKDKPSDEVTAAIICLGGPYQMVRLWEIIGYNHRRNAVDHWYEHLLTEPKRPASTADPRRLVPTISHGGQPSASSSSQAPQHHTPAPAPTKTKHKFLGRLGRKKSNSGMRDAAAAAVLPTPPASSISSPTVGTSPFPASDAYNPLSPANDLLLRGRPMAPLHAHVARKLVPDMPVLQKIWMVTAEALILERRVVQRAQDIKRNAQVLFDLIREPSLADEDEIWYGREVLDALQPPMKTMPMQADMMDLDEPM
ncbi:hypothetical protein TD95_001907 [Thielaviopsis punctulata]|uniref:F-box domain-containing protein n=1 Tax=Thielaviopsis punctulata TaxID=72032 RepID=A0A0F4ZHW7_9PEZI|nr:hypothetical protein TD95_001907 [Thielaviopsis punctulata]